jgi:DNA polymerase-1
MNDYFVAYPGIKDYMEKNKEEARLNGYVKTIFNRKRLIPEINDRNFIVRNQGERIALNTPIQGSAADIMKKAMNDVALEFKKNDLKSKLILQVHDEIIIDCKKDEKDIVVKILKEKMENAYKLSVPLKVDINIGNTWYEAK